MLQASVLDSPTTQRYQMSVEELDSTREFALQGYESEEECMADKTVGDMEEVCKKKTLSLNAISSLR